MLSAGDLRLGGEADSSCFTGGDLNPEERKALIERGVETPAAAPGRRRDSALLALGACAHAPRAPQPSPNTPPRPTGQPFGLRTCPQQRGSRGAASPRDPRPTGLGGEGPLRCPQKGRPAGRRTDGRRPGNHSQGRQNDPPGPEGHGRQASGQRADSRPALRAAPACNARSLAPSVTHLLLPSCVSSFASAFLGSRARSALTLGQGLSQDNALETPVQPDLQ